MLDREARSTRYNRARGARPRIRCKRTWRSSSQRASSVSCSRRLRTAPIDFAAAFRILADLPIGTLLTVLDVIERRNGLAELKGNQCAG
ncbi:MAG TPA: hypothetical protein VIV60_00795, partial [Polyangiaceae bacterium]